MTDTFKHHDELITRKRWLIEQVYLDALRTGTSVIFGLAEEAVATTALEHPEWDMNETKTRSEWHNG